jgi:hypothetical protein
MNCEEFEKKKTVVMEQFEGLLFGFSQSAYIASSKSCLHMQEPVIVSLLH